jgi:chemotaxis protein MotD
MGMLGGTARMAGSVGKELPVAPLASQELGDSTKLITASDAEPTPEEALYALALAQGLSPEVVAAVLWPGGDRAQGGLPLASDGSAGVTASDQDHSALASSVEVAADGLALPASLKLEMAGAGFVAARADGAAGSGGGLMGFAGRDVALPVQSANEFRVTGQRSRSIDISQLVESGAGSVKTPLPQATPEPKASGPAPAAALSGLASIVSGASGGGRPAGVGASAPSVALTPGASVQGFSTIGIAGSGKDAATQALAGASTGAPGADPSPASEFVPVAIRAERGDPRTRARLDSSAAVADEFASRLSVAANGTGGRAPDGPMMMPAAQWMIRHAGGGGMDGSLGLTDAARVPVEAVDPAKAAAESLRGGGADDPVGTFSGQRIDPIDLSAEGQGDSTPGRSGVDREGMQQKMSEALAQRIVAQASRGQWNLQIELKPADLGQISIDMSVQNGRLEAVFDAASPAARALIADGFERLRGELERAGMNVASLSMQSASSGSNGGKPTPGRFDKRVEGRIDSDAAPDDGSGGITSRSGARDDRRLDLMV